MVALKVEETAFAKDRHKAAYSDVLKVHELVVKLAFLKVSYSAF